MIKFSNKVFLHLINKQNIMYYCGIFAIEKYLPKFHKFLEDGSARNCTIALSI